MNRSHATNKGADDMLQPVNSNIVDVQPAKPCGACRQPGVTVTMRRKDGTTFTAWTHDDGSFQQWTGGLG